MSSLKIKNYYKIIPKEDKEDNVQLSYPLEKELKISLPFRQMLIGSSGAGKTNLSLNEISIFNFSKIYLYAKCLNEPLWKALIDRLEEKGEEIGEELIIYDDKIFDHQTKQSTIFSPLDFDKSLNNLLLIDDHNPQSKPEMAVLNEHFSYGRKHNVSIIFSCHNFFQSSAQTWKNSCNLFIFKGINRPDVLRRIMKTFEDSEVSQNRLVAMYNVCFTKKDPLECFFTIDTTLNQDPKYKYRNGFLPFTESELKEIDKITHRLDKRK